MKRVVLLGILSALLVLLIGLNIAQQPVPTSPPNTLATVRNTYLRNPRLGIAHISAAEGGTPEERYRNALELGAGWNRFPLYWDRIETGPDTFNWEAYDRQVTDDLRHGLNINAILLGRPAFYQDEFRIAGMHEPIYADGTDTPAENFDEPKPFNPANPWVRFVDMAVRRYKPGGVLTQQGTIPDGYGITIWEVWNEPDHEPFWGGSIGDYARLLKISYIVIKQADPFAQVMFGGLLFSDPDNNWLAQVLRIYANDPFVERNNWYMDIVALHSYGSPWRTGWLTLWVRQTLIAYELDKPIWVNETGVPVWDDYPGPIWANIEDPERISRATLEQQAWFYIQSAVYAWKEGASIIIYHQLYDDCGDQGAGTNFPPHNGSLCTTDAEGEPVTCFGDAHGIYRNEPTSVCFSQHPRPGTARPAADAFQLLAQVFREPFLRGREIIDEENPAPVVIEFERAEGDERVIVMWNRTFEPTTASIPSVGENAQLVSIHSIRHIEPDANGNYQINLTPALPDAYPEIPFGADAAIGGEPLFLIEKRGDSIEPFVRYRPPTPGTVTMRDIVGNQNNMANQNEIATVATVTPEVDFSGVPATDTTPPEGFLNPLPVISAPSFTLSWRGEDNTGVESYLIWVRADEGEWEVWLETSDTSATFTGVRGSRYDFDIWVKDVAGNWSNNIELTSKVSTRIE